MRTLRTKLLLTFLLISVVGTVFTAVVVRLSNERAFNTLLLEQSRFNFGQNALVYYESNGSWQGVAHALRPNAPGAPNPPPPFALADRQGRVVIPNGPYQLGATLPPPLLEEGVPLMQNGAQIATIVTNERTVPRDPAAITYAAQTNRALLIGAVAATAVAIVLAILLARTLTQPLQELATASRQISQGELQQELPIRTNDELGDLAAAFNQMSADLARATQTRRQMTADIAHDLRTPLTVLSGYLEAMSDGTLAATPARLQLMQDEVLVLTRLVEDLRTLSLADAGELVLQIEPLNVNELLAQVQAAYLPQAAEQGVDIVAHTAVDNPIVAGDEARLRQALGNLLSNSLRYTQAGDTIALECESKSDERVALTIADTGAGIPTADLPHVFDRFYRADPARQAGTGGSGLGLAIVKSVVTAHGGRVVADSVPGEGATFTIFLPISSSQQTASTSTTAVG